MGKAFGKRCAMGALIGVAADYLAAAAVSCWLNLGYFMPCLAALPEQVGGEMNAVMLQLAVCALLGAGAGAACHILLERRRPIRKNLFCAAAAFAGFLVPAALLAACMMK